MSLKNILKDLYSSNFGRRVESQCKINDLVQSDELIINEDVVEVFQRTSNSGVHSWYVSEYKTKDENVYILKDAKQEGMFDEPEYKILSYSNLLSFLKRKSLLVRTPSIIIRDENIKEDLYEIIGV